MSKPKDRMWLGPELPSGNRPFLRATLEGEHPVAEVGLTGSPETLPGADSLVELRHVAGCEYAVTEEVKFTASGPAQVSTAAYRDGWARVFGNKTVGQA